MTDRPDSDRAGGATRSRRFRPDGRAQSINISYTIGLGLALILVTGLLIAGGDFVDNQRERAARVELQVLGQQLSADMSTADRLAQTAESDETVTVRRSFPETIAGSGYRIRVVERPNAVLRLTTDGDPGVTVTVELANQTSVAATNVSGGNLRINYSSEQLVLESGGDQ
jgi:hypothetical protein